MKLVRVIGPSGMEHESVECADEDADDVARYFKENKYGSGYIIDISDAEGE